MQNLTQLKSFLSTPKKVLITTHHNPDADALGSSLGLASYLRKMKHEVFVVTPSSHPVFLNWMPIQEYVTIYSDNNLKKINKLFEETDVIFFLDFSAYSRLRYMEKIAEESKKVKVVIDHHLNPSIKSDYALWDSNASSTAELVYDFIEMLDGKEMIDTDLAECLYAGIVTDTSSFKHPSTTIRVHQITAEMMQKGLDTNKIQRLIYDNNTEDKIRLLGYLLRDNLTVKRKFRTAYFAIKHEDLKKFNYQQGDAEGVVNYALSIQNVVFAAIFIEKDDCVKISFRSTGDFPANEFASEHFNGGGHKNASGGISFISLEQTVKTFLNLLPKYNKKLTETIK